MPTYKNTSHSAITVNGILFKVGENVQTEMIISHPDLDIISPYPLFNPLTRFHTVFGDGTNEEVILIDTENTKKIKIFRLLAGNLFIFLENTSNHPPMVLFPGKTIEIEVNRNCSQLVLYFSVESSCLIEEISHFTKYHSDPSSSTNVQIDGGTLVLSPSENHIGEVGGKTTTGVFEFVRPDDTIDYDPNDIVSDDTTGITLMEFDIGRIDGSTGYITKALLLTDNPACFSSFAIWLFNSPDIMIQSDNDPLLLLYENREKIIGSIFIDELETGEAGSDSAWNFNADVRISFHCLSDSTKIYGLIQTLDGFTPIANQKFCVTLTAELN